LGELHQLALVIVLLVFPHRLFLIVRRRRYMCGVFTSGRRRSRSRIIDWLYRRCWSRCWSWFAGWAVSTR
jgi:hypothetical protein